MNNAYWIVHICAGEPTLWGPYTSDAERQDEFDMCTIHPGTEYIILIDPTQTEKPHIWLPSKEYVNERRDYINNVED